jgi:hypothetical protein
MTQSRNIQNRATHMYKNTIQTLVDIIRESNKEIKLKLIAPGYYQGEVITKLDGKQVKAKAEIVKIEGKPNWSVRLSSNGKDFLDGTEEWHRSKKDAILGLKDCLNLGFKTDSGYGIVLSD